MQGSPGIKQELDRQGRACQYHIEKFPNAAPNSALFLSES